MPRILGIDTSLTKTGLALIDLAVWPPSDTPAEHPVAHSVQVATVGAPGPTANKSKARMVYRVNTLIDRIEDCFRDEDRPDHVGIENLAFAAKGENSWVLPWIFGRTLELCVKYDVPMTVVSTGSRAKFAAGKGNASKDQVLAAAIKLFPEAGITDNNEGDAAIVGAVVCQALGMPILPITQYRDEVIEGLGN